MKKNIKCMCVMLLLINMSTTLLFSMDQGSMSEDSMQEEVIDLNYHLHSFLANYREHLNNPTPGYDPSVVFNRFIWRNANDNDFISVGPYDDKIFMRYALFRLAVQNCKQNNTLSYEQIINKARRYSQGLFDTVDNG